MEDSVLLFFFLSNKERIQQARTNTPKHQMIHNELCLYEWIENAVAYVRHTDMNEIKFQTVDMLELTVTFIQVMVSLIFYLTLHQFQMMNEKVAVG